MCEDNTLMRFAEDIFGNVREAVRAIRAARSGKPLPAGELSFFEAFSEELSLKADAPLTEAHLLNALFWSLEDDADGVLIRFSTPGSIDAYLVGIADQVALKVGMHDCPEESVVLVHEDFRIYADFMRPEAFEQPAPPERQAVLNLLNQTSEVLESWIADNDMAQALSAKTDEEWLVICEARGWLWSDVDELEADVETSTLLYSTISAVPQVSDEVNRALERLKAARETAIEFQEQLIADCDRLIRN